MSSNVKLGDHVRCRISGYEGIVSARTDYLYRSSQYLVVPCRTGVNGERLDGEWFDGEQLIELAN